MGKVECAEQVCAEQTEYYYPEGEECLAVEYVPSVGEVGHREEFERESKLKKSEHYLYRIHPAARLRRALEPRGEQCEEAERYGQGEGEAGHADCRAEFVACARRLDEQCADDGACA
ncbi:hypothetical protein IMSAG192_00348 [Muribaculaceae bacterium]|nr:hypothetical protein IMSAG192_00348 [Muribaculaceae bacterium]